MIGDFFNAYENCSLAACGSLPRGITVWNSSYRDMRMMPFWDSNAEVAHVIFGFRYFNAGLVLTFIEPLGVFYRVGIFELGAFDLVALCITLRKEFQLVAKFFSVLCFHERRSEERRVGKECRTEYVTAAF